MDNAFSCKNCTDKECLKTGHICEKVEKLFRTYGIYPSEWARPERSFSNKSYKETLDAIEIPFSTLKSNFTYITNEENEERWRKARLEKNKWRKKTAEEKLLDKERKKLRNRRSI